jgi:hypothetical protein
MGDFDCHDLDRLLQLLEWTRRYSNSSHTSLAAHYRNMSCSTNLEAKADVEANGGFVLVDVLVDMPDNCQLQTRIEG